MIELDSKGKIKQIDILSFVEKDSAYEYKKIASTNGGEYAGPCPFCGGKDRFHLQPGRGLWWCRQCSPSDKWEDIIAYVMRRDNLSFREACKILDGNEIPVVDMPQLKPARRERTPSREWRESGELVVQKCIEWLWGKEGEGALLWLHNRGLIDETLRKWKIGYCPGGQVIGRLWVFKGIIIPWLLENELWYLRVRLPVKTGDKYRSLTWERNFIPGDLQAGVSIVYGAETLQGRDIVFLCEGEFDTMLLYQETGDLTGAVTLGSCSSNIDVRVIPYLLPMRKIHIAYDVDPNEAGQKGSKRFENSCGKAKRVNIPWGNDITEFHQQGGNLREWVKSFIEEPSSPPPDGATCDTCPQIPAQGAPEKLSRDASSHGELGINLDDLFLAHMLKLRAQYEQAIEAGRTEEDYSALLGIVQEILTPNDGPGRWKKPKKSEMIEPGQELPGVGGHDYTRALKQRYEAYLRERDNLTGLLDAPTIPEQHREKHLRRYDEVLWFCEDHRIKLERIDRGLPALTSKCDIYIQGKDHNFRKPEQHEAHVRELEAVSALSAPAAMSVAMDGWNRNVYDKQAVRVSRDSEGQIRCELM